MGIPWTPNDIGIDIIDEERGCWQHADQNGQNTFSGGPCGQMHGWGFADMRLRVEVRVDHAWSPRPAPFDPPGLHIVLEFQPDGTAGGGQPTFEVRRGDRGVIPANNQGKWDIKDPSLQYVKAGDPLTTGFGGRLLFLANVSGTLTWGFVLSDAGTGSRGTGMIFLTDKVKFVVHPGTP